MFWDPLRYTVIYESIRDGPADIPSRLHEMSREEARRQTQDLGRKVEMRTPAFADERGEWLSSKDIAASAWG